MIVFIVIITVIIIVTVGVRQEVPPDNLCELAAYALPSQEYNTLCYDITDANIINM